MAERQRTGIAISGVDIASPDHSVTDGKCEQLHNMRYANGAWRNIHPFEVVKTFTQGDIKYNIIYKHPLAEENEYIAQSEGPINYKYCYEDEAGYLYWSEKETIDEGDKIIVGNPLNVGYIISGVTTNDDNTISITYRDGNDYCIVSDLSRNSADDYSEQGKYVSLIEVLDNGDINNIQTFYKTNIVNAITIHHFGNILIINNHTEKQLLYFIRKHSSYLHIDWDALNITSTVNAGAWNMVSENLQIEAVSSNDNVYPPHGFNEEGIVLYEKICNTDFTEYYFEDFLENDNVWRGEIAVFYALRDESGSILYKSSPQILRSTFLADCRTPDTARIVAHNYDGDGYYALCGYKGSFEHIDGLRSGYAASFHNFVAPQVGLSLNMGNSKIVCEIAVYSTRLYSLINRNNTTGNQLGLHNDIDLMQEPFYLMKTIKIDSQKENADITFQIKYSDLKNIEQKTLYVPNISPNLLYADILTEYNNSLHLSSVHKLLHPLKSDNIVKEDAGAELIIVEWENDSTTIYFSDAQKFSFVQNFLVTFPQNVSYIYWANKYGEKYEVFGKLRMAYSATLDTSYFINKIEKPLLPAYSDEVVKYVFNKYNPTIDISIPDEYVIDVISTLSIKEGNRIQTSQPNNPFNFPYENSYRVGSDTSHIIAANSAAVEMSDAKFGEFPLYVFTDEGVFAMQSGGENTLYSAIVPISYDKIIQPNTLAVNYNVLFVTKEGIMALSSQGVRQLSQELDNLNSNLPEWMKTTQLLHLPRFNEIVATDFANKMLYVYSTSQQVWSSRDVESGRLLNNGEIVADNNAIYNLLSEDDNTTNTEVTILTRPIKLGSMELKRLETFILRFEASTAQTIEIQLYGSTDTVNWIKFREVSVYTNRDIIIRRVPLSAKYLRVEITGAVTDDIRIIAMEMEYYLRMLHRMR